MMWGLLQSLGYEVTVAALGGAVVLCFVQAKRRFKNARLEKQYPVAGEYISLFEDEDQGSKVVMKAPVTLRQKGRQIVGETTLPGGRKWILRGELSEDGYFHGLYHAAALQDKGVGNFFLEMDYRGNLEGIWSGYDSHNRKVQSGRYSFVKKSKVRIHKFRERYMSAVMDIAENQLGAAYIDESELRDESNIALVASVDKEIAGFCLARKIDLDHLYKMVPQLRTENIKRLKFLDQVGLVSSIATASKFQGCGVGSELMTRALSGLESLDVHTMVMTGWKSERGVHIESIGHKNGFNEVIEIPHFWHEDSQQYGYRCPSCGEPPCDCSAVVYIRHAKMATREDD